MSTRFGPASSSEIWAHLNVIDDDLIAIRGGWRADVAITPAPNWTVTSHLLLRRNSCALGVLNLTYTGTGVATNANAVFSAYQKICTLPAEFFLRAGLGGAWNLPVMELTGVPVRSWRGLMDGAGGVYLIGSGVANQALANGATLRMQLDSYPVA